uniref:Uncharacterized protein n=1 Tax=Amphimedon queenslandica TaxID=400682 RepID=A0A1X7URC2_AMPQE
MAGFYNENPFWINKIITSNPNRFGPRRFVGVRKADLEDFLGKLVLTLKKPVEEPTEVGRNVIDIDSKEFRNNGSETDKFSLKTQTTDEVQAKKTYQLKVGKNTTIGGEAGLEVGAKFFNVGGVGISAKGSASRTKTKEEVTTEESTRSLSQVYGIDGKMDVPKNKFVKVRITTYAVSYSAKAELIAEMPYNAYLEVLAPRTDWKGLWGQACWCNKTYITAQDLLQAYTETHNPIVPDRNTGIARVDFTSELLYLGEVTKIDKESEAPISEARPLEEPRDLK